MPDDADYLTSYKVYQPNDIDDWFLLAVEESSTKWPLINKVRNIWVGAIFRSSTILKDALAHQLYDRDVYYLS